MAPQHTEDEESMHMKKNLVKAGIAAFAVLAVVAVSGKVAVKAAGKLNGTAYIAGHGGHLAIVDLATMREPTDANKDRIVITEAGSEMEGKIAGMDFEKVKSGGGSHGSALLDKKLYVGLLNGKMVVYDLATGKKGAPVDVGKKFCDVIVGPDGKLYMEDMGDGNVYVWDTKSMKLADKMPIGAAVCGIAWTKNNEKAYISDMPLGIVHVIDWKTKKEIAKITDEGMTFIHQVKMAPDGEHLWVTAPNEFGPKGPGQPNLGPRNQKPQIVIIDTKTDKVVEKIVLPDDVNLHDVEFSPDGKTVLIPARTYGNDSILAVMDYDTKKITQKVSLCYGCHKKEGVEVTMDNKSPLLCGIVVDWK
jgi:DNA-binding beta-propeller fold protein YncE